MMIKYENKISKVLSIIGFISPFPAIVFIILFWVMKNEFFLTLTFACTALFFLSNGIANMLEIKHCMRKEEKKALKLLGIPALIAAVAFIGVTLFRIFM